MSERVQVAVVGGGITGLTLGYHLQKLGVSYAVLEASDRPGGVIQSGRVDGHLLEWGPQRTRMTRGISALIDELGLENEVVTAPTDLSLFVYRKGRLREVPFNPVAFLRSDIVSPLAKIRLLLEPLGRAADPEERVADFLIRKVGRPIYENMLGPLYGGLYASDPADMVVGLSLGHVLREFGIGRSLLLPLLKRGGSLSPPAACSFRDGLATLPRALAAGLTDFHTGAKARFIEADGDGWLVDTDAGELSAERVVLTIPAAAASQLMGPLAPDTAKALRKLRYNPLAVVHLHADTDLRGLGFQVSFAEKLATRGVTFNDSLFDREGVYTVYLGGAKAPGVVDWDDREIAHVAKREFKAITGFEARTLSVAREWMPAWDYSWAALARVRPPPGIHFAANWRARPGLPGRLAEAESLAKQLAAECFG